MLSCRSRLDQTQPPTSTMPAMLTAPATPRRRPVLPRPQPTPSSPSSSTSVTLSDEAKAYLAQTAADSEQPSVATLATRARAWFDQQYVALGTSSAMLDGQVAVDFSGQTRATLSVIADNAQSQFSPDEVTAATRTLQSRFNDAVSPHVVIARHTRRLCKPLRRGVGLSRSGRQRREGNGGLERSEAGRAGGPGRRAGELRQGSRHRQRGGPGESAARQGADTKPLRDGLKPGHAGSERAGDARRAGGQREGQRQGPGIHRRQADRAAGRFHGLRQSNPGRHGAERRCVILGAGGRRCEGGAQSAHTKQPVERLRSAMASGPAVWRYFSNIKHEFRGTKRSRLH